MRKLWLALFLFLFVAPVEAQEIFSASDRMRVAVGDSLPLQISGGKWWSRPRTDAVWVSSDSTIVDLEGFRYGTFAVGKRPGLALVWATYGRTDKSDTISVTVDGVIPPDTIPTDTLPTPIGGPQVVFIGEDTAGVGSLLTFDVQRAASEEYFNTIINAVEPLVVPVFGVEVESVTATEVVIAHDLLRVQFRAMPGPARIRITGMPGDLVGTDTSFVVQADPVLPPDTTIPPDTTSPPDTTTTPPDTLPTPPDSTVTPPVPSPTAPELPRSQVDWSEPVSTDTIRVAPGGLQAAIDLAVGGERIMLEPGGIYGPIILPAHGSGTVVIQTDAAIPVGRMTQAGCAALGCAIIEGGQFNVPVIQATGDVSGWYLQGLEVRRAPGVVVLGVLIDIISDAAGAQPSDIILNQMYVHGDAFGGFQLKRCLGLNGARVAVVNSSLLDCTKLGQESQGVLIGDGEGPTAVHNNHIQAGSIGLLSGGVDPVIANRTPADITVTGNYFHRPQSWKTTKVGVVKNQFELKNAERVLFEGNVLEGNWADGQEGWTILLKSANQNGGCTWCQTSDVTIRWNLIDNGQSGIQVTHLASTTTPGGQTHNVLVHDNVFARLGSNGDNPGWGTPLWLFGQPNQIVVRNNTFDNRGSNHWSLASNLGGSYTGTHVDFNVGWHGMFGIWEANGASPFPEQGNVVVPDTQSPQTQTVTLAGMTYTLLTSSGAGANLDELAVRLGGVR